METKDLSSKDYEKIDKLIPSQIPELRKKLLEKHGIVVPDHCNIFLSRCLRMKDGNVEKAVKLVKAFKSTIASSETWDATFLPSENEHFYKSGCLSVLPKRDSKGRIMGLARLGLWDPDKVRADQLYCCFWMFAEYLSCQFKDAQQLGFVCVFDVSNFTMKHAWAINKWRLLDVGKICQGGVAGRLKEYHGVNVPRIISIIYAAIKPFLKKKFTRRIFFHDSHDALLEHFDKHSLPITTGGTLSEEECVDSDLLKKLLEQDNYFADMIKCGFPSK